MDKKQLVSLIKKIAQDTGDPPLPPTDSPSPTPNVGGGRGFINPPSANRPAKSIEVQSPSSVGNSNANIIRMQSELVNLARSVTSEINTAALQGTPGQQEPTPEQQEAGGRASFGDFVAQHYMRQSDVPGVEFSPDPNRTEMAGKDPTQVTRMNTVMETMQRVGNPKSGEFKVDGLWGPRTNAALHNAYAYAFALLKMSQDFGYTPKTFDQNRLQQLEQLIEHVPVGEEKQVSAQEKGELAGEIIPFVRGIKHLFQEVKQHILQKPAYRSYIEGSQSFATYKGKQEFTPQMIASLNQKFANIKITQPAQKGVSQVVRPISVNDLVNVQALQAWQKNNMPNMPLPNILQQVKQHLDETDVSRGQV